MRKKRQLLVIHCTATPEGLQVSAEAVKHFHTVTKGWDRVGYSKLVLLDGSIHSFVYENDDEYVDEWEITYGVGRNVNSIAQHICYVGGIAKAFGKPKDTRTEAQKKSLETLVRASIKRNPEIKIAGHYEFSARACPSFNVAEWLKSLNIPAKNIYVK